MMIDPELLRTFLAFADSGSLARAAEAVHRSPSAVTAQMQRLEDMLGEPLLTVSGRGRTLTPAGAELVGHARRIVSAHREAWLSIKGARADGRIGIGITQDFAESGLPELIRAFARSHPRVRLDLRVGRSAELSNGLDTGALQIAITLKAGPTAEDIGAIVEPMEWLCARDGLVVPHDDIPLAMLDAPCGFRSAAIAALEASGRAYRLAATSSSLTGLRAAVLGGIAVTARTQRWIGPGVAIAPDDLGLPKLGVAEFSIRLRADAGQAASDFAVLLREGLGGR